VLFRSWFGSLEVRLRSKVNASRFGDLKGQVERIETHIYQLLTAQRMEPWADPPDEIKKKNNSEKMPE